jgi:hypothetical protein
MSLMSISSEQVGGRRCYALLLERQVSRAWLVQGTVAKTIPSQPLAITKLPSSLRLDVKCKRTKCKGLF